MSINDICDAIEYQDVWSSWQLAYQDNAMAERERKRAIEQAMSQAGR